jgi:hypothetical protein
MGQRLIFLFALLLGLAVLALPDVGWPQDFRGDTAWWLRHCHWFYQVPEYWTDQAQVHICERAARWLVQAP